MRSNINQLHDEIKAGSFRAIARGITIVENELDGYEFLMEHLRKNNHTPVIGITGPPGAGKSTLVNAILHHWLGKNLKVAVIAVDPSSPFNYGALLGDRIRMSEFYTNPNIYIRSLASRGALGGLSSKIIEITDLVRDAQFDVVVVETVGVGQSEVEIAGLADCTVVVLVPEAGDEIQAIKAGIMEVADIFVVNKADHENADAFYHNLRMMAHEKAGSGTETPVVKTVASGSVGIEALAEEIDVFLKSRGDFPEKRMQLLTEKCWSIIQTQRMKPISHEQLKKELAAALTDEDFNLYTFTKAFMKKVLP